MDTRVMAKKLPPRDYSNHTSTQLYPLLHPASSLLLRLYTCFVPCLHALGHQQNDEMALMPLHLFAGWVFW